MKNLFKRGFVFQANRYEEWQSGSCISKGPISTKIIANSDEDSISFELQGIDGLRINTEFGFEFSNSDILHDRIQYLTSSNFDSVVPVICHLFCSNNTIDYVRFAMTNPDRIIEFYGHIVSIDEAPSNKPSKAKIKTLIETIDHIKSQILELEEGSPNMDGFQVFQMCKMYDMFKLPLLAAWQAYGYGWHSDFWEEGESMFDYMMFSVKAREILSDLLKALKQQSPFAQIERNSMITNGLISVYIHLLTTDFESKL